MKRKIQHALVQYTVDGRQELAFRNQIVDIPDDQVERLDALGATVAADVDLQRPGKMMTLPDSATDAEIMSWVVGATNAEVEDLVRERPVMAERILAAHATVAERFSEQNIHLGGLKQIAEEAEATAKAQADAALLAGLSEADLAVVRQLVGLTDDEVLGLAELAEAQTQADLIGDTFDADKIVAGSAKSVTDYIAENPHRAAAILDAEGRRAIASKEDARVTIIRAAEAAAGFTQ